MLTVTLFEPKIPPNTGNIARLCGANNVKLDLVGNLGFDMEDKYLKRAGLDYWDHIKWEYFPSIDEYCLNAFQNQEHTRSSYLQHFLLVCKQIFVIFSFAKVCRK